MTILGLIQLQVSNLTGLYSSINSLSEKRVSTLNKKILKYQLQIIFPKLLPRCFALASS